MESRHRQSLTYNKIGKSFPEIASVLCRVYRTRPPAADRYVLRPRDDDDWGEAGSARVMLFDCSEWASLSDVLLDRGRYRDIELVDVHHVRTLRQLRNLESGYEYLKTLCVCASHFKRQQGIRHHLQAKFIDPNCWSCRAVYAIQRKMGQIAAASHERAKREGGFTAGLEEPFQMPAVVHPETRRKYLQLLTSGQPPPEPPWLRQ